MRDDNTLYLRRATQDDCELLYEWVNDEEVRKNALDPHEITLDEHRTWFDKMMNDVAQVQYILMQDERSVGQVRVTMEDDVAEIHYSIAPDARGQGLGQELIHLVVDMIRDEYPQIMKVMGKIKPSNIASFRCFSKNEFEESYMCMEYSLTQPKSLEPRGKSS